MKELKKGDFTGIYSSIDGKPLYFTGVYSCMEYDGMPCVFLATDLHNNLTFCRWSQQDLNKRGFTIPPEPVRISKTAMQMLQKAGAVIRWTTAAERKAANTDHKRMSAYIITTAAGDFYTTGTCADVREILKAAQAAPEESTPATEATQDTTTGAQDGPNTPESNTAGENTTGANKAPEEATSETTKYYYIVENENGETVAAGEVVAANIEKALQTVATEAAAATRNYINDTGRKARFSYGGSMTPIAEAARQYMNTQRPQEGPTSDGTSASEETPTTAETAPQEATSEATTAETATEGPETSTATQDTTGSDTRPPRATEDATTGHAAGDTSTPANQEPGTAAGYSNKAQQDATTCDIMRQHATPGHACENAPGRTERAQAEQVHTSHTKSPPRAQTRAGRNTSRSHPDRRKVTFSAWMYKTGSDPPKI